MAANVNESLIRAAVDGSLEGVKAALEAGADVDFCLPFHPHTDGLSCTAMHNAVLMEHVDVVKLLLRKGASLVKRVTQFGYCPLHAAAMKGNTEIVELFVHHGATVDIQDAFEMTPIMQACMEGHVDTVRQLIGFGARVDLVLDQENFSVQWYCEVKENDSKKRECLRLVKEARETRLLRCCNPKCNKPGYRSYLKLCAGCKLTRYCSRECQRQHWSGGHKNCCGQDAYSGPVPQQNDLANTLQQGGMEEAAHHVRTGKWLHRTC